MSKLAEQTLDIQEMIELFQVTEVAIGRWVKDAGFPKSSRGKYPLVACVHWRLADLRRQKRHGDEASQEAERREAIAKANMAERKDALQARQVVTLAEVQRLLSGPLILLQQQLRTIGAKVAPMVVNVSDQNIIKAEIDRFVDDTLEQCSRLSDGLDSYASFEEDDAPEAVSPVETSPTKNRERVGRREQSPKSGGKRRAGKVANGQGSVPERADGLPDGSHGGEDHDNEIGEDRRDGGTE